MDPIDVDSADDQFTVLLVAYDEAMAMGTTSEVPVQMPPQISQRLQRARACLHLLDRHWPRRLPEGSPASEAGGLQPG